MCADSDLSCCACCLMAHHAEASRSKSYTRPMPTACLPCPCAPMQAGAATGALGMGSVAGLRWLSDSVLPRTRSVEQAQEPGKWPARYAMQGGMGWGCSLRNHRVKQNLPGNKGVRLHHHVTFPFRIRIAPAGAK